ncbi:MAG: endonuclease/exonuclease/phosphatase family protein [Bryocella sp.]
MRLISWNLNGRRSKANAQVAALLEREPDVVAFQEVIRSSLPLLRHALVDGGLVHVADSFSLAPPDFQPYGPRKYGQITASRHPLTATAPEHFPVPWPERVLSVLINCDGDELEVHNTHVPPGSSNGWIKVGVLEGIFTALAVPTTHPRILCGDFNTPQAEMPSGEVVTWAQRRTTGGGWRVVGKLRGGAGADWDAAERLVLTGLADFDLVDVYRALHGYDVSETSWVFTRQGKEIGRRFDHVFASRELQPVSCQYLHDLRKNGLSDHAPIEATFEFREPALER